MKAGITGHQNIDNYDIKWIRNSLLKKIKSKEITLGYSSLAIGTDQLFIKILLEFEIPYKIIVPCKKYEKTFTIENDRINYLELLDKAKEKIILDYDEPSELAFYDAGKKVVDLSDLIVTVWDGEKSKGLGGTADIVSYALARQKKIFHINPLTKIKKMLD